MGQINISITPTSVCKYYTVSDAERFRNSVISQTGLRSTPHRSAGSPVAKNSRKVNELSDRARKRIRNSVNWLAYLSGSQEQKYNKKDKSKKFNLAFWTLTLPTKQLHEHSEIKKVCLNNFLTVMRQKFNLKNYIWVAELQANGNIHFHITCDVYVHYMELRRIWNQSINLLGYVDDYAKIRESMTFDDYKYWRGQEGATDQAKILKSFNHGKNTEWRDPNTTDVKSVRDIKSMGAYLAKYISKNVGIETRSGPFADSLESFTGRLWFCSTSLSRLSTVKLYMSDKYRRFFDMLKSVRSAFRVERDFIDMVFFQIGTIPKMLKEFLRQELVSHAIKSGYHFQCRIETIGI